LQKCFFCTYELNIKSFPESLEAEASVFFGGQKTVLSFDGKLIRRRQKSLIF